MDNEDLRRKWDARHAGAETTPEPMALLAQYKHLLPQSGDALDIAAGSGGNALLLASRGLRTEAWDISAVAMDNLRKRAAGLSLRALARDVVAKPPPANSFDVISVGHFLDRSLCPQMAAALRPGGLLFYQTFSLDRVDDSGPRDGPYRLEVNELLRLFPALTVRFYRDEGGVGDIAKGFRNRAQLIAQRSC